MVVTTPEKAGQTYTGVAQWYAITHLQTILKSGSSIALGIFKPALLGNDDDDGLFLGEDRYFSSTLPLRAHFVEQMEQQLSA